MTLTVDAGTTLTGSITLRAGVEENLLSDQEANRPRSRMTVPQSDDKDAGKDVELSTTKEDSDDCADPAAVVVEGASSPNGTSGTSGASASGASANNPRLARKLSISEIAQEGSSGRCRAPGFIRWLEVPFRVRNNNTGMYLEEATGHAMDVSARGPINQTGSFVGNAMMLIAAREAGGINEKIYGMKASSILAFASLIVGVFAGVTMPFVGAIVDHTDHRKVMGAVSAAVTVLSVGFQLILNPDTWFAVFILEIIGGYFLIMHQVCTMAYMPDLSHEADEISHYAARFMMTQYCVQGCFTTIVIVAGNTTTLTNLATAKLAAGMATALGAILFGYSWTFLMRKRPRLRQIPPGQTLFTTAPKTLYATARHVFREYKTLKWFMIALLFSPEAGAGVVLSIAVTFLTFYVKMGVKEIAVVSLTMLFANIPGAHLSRVMCRRINPLNSFRCAEIMFATVNALIAGTVTGSTRRDWNLVYFYAALVGVAFGWMFPSQRTLAVALIPKGQETEIMGLISFFGQVVGWLPVFVFAAMNEAGVSMRWGLAIVSFFLLTSFFFTLFCGKYEDAVALVHHTSDQYTEEFRRKSGIDNVSAEEGEAGGRETGNTDVGVEERA